MWSGWGGTTRIRFARSKQNSKVMPCDHASFPQSFVTYLLKVPPWRYATERCWLQILYRHARYCTAMCNTCGLSRPVWALAYERMWLEDPKCRKVTTSGFRRGCVIVRGEVAARDDPDCTQWETEIGSICTWSASGQKLPMHNIALLPTII